MGDTSHNGRTYISCVAVSLYTVLQSHCTLCCSLTVHCVAVSLYTVLQSHCTLCCSLTVHCVSVSLYTVLQSHCTLGCSLTVHWVAVSLYTGLQSHCTLCCSLTVHWVAVSPKFSGIVGYKDKDSVVIVTLTGRAVLQSTQKVLHIFLICARWIM